MKALFRLLWVVLCGISFSSYSQTTESNFGQLIIEAAGQVYVGDNLLIKVKLPANVAVALSDIPVILTYKGKDGSNTLMSVIPEGQKETKFNIPTSKAGSLTMSVEAPSKSYLASHTTVVILQTYHLVFAVTEKAYGGANMAVKVTAPGDASILEDVPVTLVYSEHANGTLEGVIRAGTKELLFDVPTTQVKGNSQFLNLSLNVEKPFIAPAQKRVTILQAQQLMWEAESQVYGGNDVPVIIKIPTNVEVATQVTTVSLTYDGPVSGTLTATISAGARQVAFNIPMAQLSDDDQKLTLSAVVMSGPFLAPIDRIIAVLPSLKEPLELHANQTRIYGGDHVTLPITVSVPLGRENLLEAVTVTLSYLFKGVATKHMITIPKGANQALFQMPVAHLDGSLDQELIISTAATKHFLASDPITITVRAADAPTYELQVAATSILGGTPFMVKVKIPSSATKSIPVELDWDDDQDDLFEVPDDIKIEPGQTEVAFDVVAKKVYGNDKIVSLLPIVPHFKDPTEWSLVILQSGEQTPDVENETPDSKTIQVYGGTNVSIPVNVEATSCSTTVVKAFSLTYQGTAEGLVGSKIKSVTLTDNKGKFNMRVNANTSTEDRLLTISTNDDGVSAMTKKVLVVRVLKKGKAKLDISVLGSSNPKIYSQEHTIPVKLTIPKNAVNDLTESTIRLNYSTDASKYIELIPSVTLEAGKDEVAFELRIKKSWDTPQLITVTATHKEGNFTSSDPLNIQLSKRSLELSGRDSKSNSYYSGNLNPIDIFGGQYVALKVRISGRADQNKRTVNVPVTITYTGDGADFIQDPVKSITLDPNNDEGTVWVKVKNITDANPKKLRIQATSSNIVSSPIFDFQLNKNVDIMLKNSNTTISLPPLPKLYLGRDNKVEVSTSESIYRCAEPLKGFWVSFRLQGKENGKELVHIATDKISKTFDRTKTFSNQFASIWVPLKKDIQNDQNSYYWITTSYQPGEHQMLSPGSSTSASYDVTYSVNTNLVHTNEKGEVNKQSKQATNGGSHGGSVEVGVTLNAGVGIEGVAMAKKSLSVAIKGHKEWSWSDVTGTVKDVSLSAQFKDELGQSKTDKYRVSLTRTGPPVGFNRVFVPIYPKIAYSFGDPSSKNAIPLASYIDFSVFGSSVSRDLTLVDFINQVFQTNTGGELTNLEKYLTLYKEQLSGGADEALEKISRVITEHTDKIGNITAHDYAVGIINSSMQGCEGVTPQELHIDVPIDCELSADVTVEQFFKRLPDGLNACFMFKNLPYSAAETELKIIRIDKNGNEELVHQRSEPRDVDMNYKEPLTELSNVLFELENNGSYKAYLRYRCARGQWSKQYEKSFTLDRLACSIPENSISASPLPGGGIKVTWAAPSGGAAGYYVEYSTGGNTFETVKGNSSSYSSSHRFDIPLPGESYTYMGNGEVSFRITPACRLGNGASVVFRYRVSTTCKAPPAPKVGPSANGKRLLIQLDHDGNPYLDGYTLQVRKGGDPWTAVEREYRSIKQKYAGSNRNERLITDVETDFFKPDMSTADKDRVRIARVKATCSDGETVWSQDSAPFDVSFLVNTSQAKNLQSASSLGTNSAKSGISLSAYDAKSSSINEPILEPELRIFPNCIEGNEVVFSILHLQKAIMAADIYVFKVNGVQSGNQTFKFTAVDILPGQSVRLQAPTLAQDNANGMYVLHMIPQQGAVVKPLQRLFCKQD